MDNNSTGTMLRRVNFVTITEQTNCGSSSSDINPLLNSVDKQGQEKADQKPSSSQGTYHKEINRSLETFLNSKKPCPDFNDIKRIVKQTNENCNLNLSDGKIDDIAQDTCIDIVTMLQTRRHQVYIASLEYIQTCDLSEDPYLTDPEFRSKFDANRQVAKHNLDNGMML